MSAFEGDPDHIVKKARNKPAGQIRTDKSRHLLSAHQPFSYLRVERGYAKPDSRCYS